MIKHLPTFLRRKHRFTARTRLAFSYALLMILCGGLLLTPGDAVHWFCARLRV